MTGAIFESPIYRLRIEATPQTGTNEPSQVMVEKSLAVPRSKCGRKIGRLDANNPLALNNMLSVMIGLAD